MQLKRITKEGLGAEPPTAGGRMGLLGNFGDFSEKKIAIFNNLDHISHVFKDQNSIIRKSFERLNCPAPSARLTNRSNSK